MSHHRFILLPSIALLLAASACSTPIDKAKTGERAHIEPLDSSETWIGDRLFFGRMIPGGGEVSEAAWQEFVDSYVTPRFPDGLTVWRAEGQWRGPDQQPIREASFVLEIFHRGDAQAEESLEAIADEYKRRFHQDAVLRASSATRVRFH